MHLLAAIPGTVSDGAAAIDLGQTPGDIVVLSAADSDLACLAAAQRRLIAEDAAWPSLRLASLFCRSRTDLDLPRFACELTDSGFRLLLPADLQEQRPLSAAALADEADEWKSIGLRLELKPLRDAAAKAA